MGWKESLGYFCSALGTSQDAVAKLVVFNGRLRKLSPYAFEEHINKPDPHFRAAAVKIDGSSHEQPPRSLLMISLP